MAEKLRLGAALFQGRRDLGQSPGQAAVEKHPRPVLDDEIRRQTQHDQAGILHDFQGAQHAEDHDGRRAQRHAQEPRVPPGLVPQHLLPLVPQVDLLLLQPLAVDRCVLGAGPLPVPGQLHDAGAQHPRAEAHAKAAEAGFPQQPRQQEDKPQKGVGRTAPKVTLFHQNRSSHG